jgi:Predicted membrane protein (DUF2142)
MQNADGSAPGTSRGATEPGLPLRSEKKIIVLLCFLAGVHIFIFSAAFPFFNNVNEAMHYDLVLKYSNGHVPLGAQPVSSDAASDIVFYRSSAYLGTPEMFPGHQMPAPPWKQPREKMRADFAQNSAALRLQPNYEAAQTPLYYACAGFWWHLGHLIGLTHGRLLYWVRFLNILFVLAIVWLAWFTARLVFPNHLFIRIAVPALLAFMPQTAFYSIGNDVLSPLCFGATFIFMVKWLDSENPPPMLGVFTGIAFAATYLTSTANLPLLAIVALAVFRKTKLSLRRFRQNASPAPWFFLTCAVPPILLWAIWCKFNFGDFAGSKLITEHFGWTIKPFSQWWHHPIFSPLGLWTYLSGQLSTFWQGEFLWHNQSMALRGTIFLDTILILTLIACAVPMLLDLDTPPIQRSALTLGLASFAAGLAFFAFLSIALNFNYCPNPSPDHPYFQSGRLLLGALIPVLLLIACGLNNALRRFDIRSKFLILCALAALMLVAEIVTDRAVFANPFNWYHLP